MAVALAVMFCACGRDKSSGVYNVMDYGAVSDTTRLSAAAFQKAIDACAAAGGGEVIVPPGDYLVANIAMKSNVHLRLQAGSTLYASRDTSHYADIPTGAADMQACQVVILARDANDIAISGPGRIHCRAVRQMYQREPKDTTVENTDFITGREIYNAARYGADYLTKYRKVLPCPSAIDLGGCSGVRITDLGVEESSGWGVHIQQCDDVAVRGVNIKSSGINGVNSDGLDIDGCSRVVISDCIIDTGDDALCLKTTKSDGEPKPCRDIAISNCVLRSSSAALKIGTESHADFERIAVTNCIINGANRGINIILRDGGDVRNVAFSDMVISTVRHAPFWWGNGDPVFFITQKRGDAKCGVIENVTMRNIIADGESGVRIENFDSKITNVRISDFQLTMHPEDGSVDKRARDAFLFKGVDGLWLSACSVVWDGYQPEWGKAYAFDDVTDLHQWQCTGADAPKRP